MQNRQHQKAFSRRALLKTGGVLAASGVLAGCGAVEFMPQMSQVAQPDPTATPSPTPLPTATPSHAHAQSSSQYRGMWISYLEWQAADCSSAESFSATIGTMFDNCVSLGLNTVMVQVRPFGDALYPSAYYPWSHFLTGTQGQDPGFDPLDIMIAEAHARGLSLEAWINPYRLRLNNTQPSYLCEQSLYRTKPEWVVAVGEGLYLNPALPEVALYVCQGVQEILENYAVDGIHFDDYFYPSTDDSIDAAQFAASGKTDRDAWRRENVTMLVKQVYHIVKSFDPILRFGISPQGNPDNNLSQQYSDVASWMNPAEGEECVDYICPQVYWGYDYTMQSGSKRFAYQNITAEWLAMPRAETVALYFGLGAYRIGEGDGGQNKDSVIQWSSGENLAAMVSDLTEGGADGYCLYRYDSLYASAYPDLAAQELAAIAAVNDVAE